VSHFWIFLLVHLNVLDCVHYALTCNVHESQNGCAHTRKDNYSDYDGRLAAIFANTANLSIF